MAPHLSKLNPIRMGSRNSLTADSRGILQTRALPEGERAILLVRSPSSAT